MTPAIPVLAPLLGPRAAVLLGKLATQSLQLSAMFLLCKLLAREVVTKVIAHRRSLKTSW